MAIDSQSAKSENPYAAPSAETEIPIITPGELQETELAAFVGPRASRYLAKWRQASPSARRTTFNWAAFFFGIFWLGYRKMYKVAVIFGGIMLLESLVQEIVFTGVLNRAVPAGLERAVNLGFALVCGFGGDGWYFSHALRSISELHAYGVEGGERLHALSVRGGTSWKSCLLVGLLIVLAFGTVYMILGILLTSMGRSPAW